MNSTSKLFLAIMSLLAASSSLAQSPSQTATIYENVRIFDGVSEKLTLPTNVLIVNNLIKTISTKPIQIPTGTTATVIAGGGRTLMPGLSEAHTQIWHTPTMDEILKGDVKQLNAAATETAKSMLLNGWTSFPD